MPPRTPSPRVVTHKERLLKEGLKQFYAVGFAGTSLESVLEKAGVPKGSFYHHFGSKESFALAVVQLYHERQREHRRKWFESGEYDAYETILGYLNDIVSAFARTGAKRGCLVGKLSLELSATSDVFASLLGTILDNWHADVERVLAKGQQAGTIRQDLSAEQLADTILSTIQGALVLDIPRRRTRSLLSISAVISTILRPDARAPRQRDTVRRG